jgi:hypothetical protein
VQNSNNREKSKFSPFDYEDNYHARLSKRKRGEKIKYDDRVYIKEMLANHPNFRSLIMKEYKLSNSTCRRIKQDEDYLKQLARDVSEQNCSKNEIKFADKSVIEAIVSPPTVPLTISSIKSQVKELTGSEYSGRTIRRFVKEGLKY